MRHTKGRAFVDSNVYLYLLDTASESKREVSRNLIEGLGSSAVSSVQVLQEVYHVSTRKMRVPHADARDFIEAIGRGRLVRSDAAMVLRAAETCDRYRISFWDAMIVEAAAEGGCSILYTEDLSHGQLLRGVEVVNPFR